MGFDPAHCWPSGSSSGGPQSLPVTSKYLQLDISCLNLIFSSLVDGATNLSSLSWLTRGTLWTWSSSPKYHPLKSWGQPKKSWSCLGAKLWVLSEAHICWFFQGPKCVRLAHFITMSGLVSPQLMSVPFKALAASLC